MKHMIRLFGLFVTLVAVNVGMGQGVWTVQDSLVTGLSDVFFVDQNNGWIITETDTILHTTDGGEHWSVQLSGIDYALSSVQFLDANNGWAVGDLGTIIHTTDGGATWHSVECDIYDLIKDIQFINDEKGWAIGENGLIMKTTDGGANWSTITFPADSAELIDVMFVDENHGWVAGSLDEASLILRTTDGGDNWQTVWHDTLVCTFTSLFFIDSTTGYVGGMRSIIQKTTDGGTSWQIQNLNAEEDESGEAEGGPSHIRDLFFVNENTGFAAGHKDSMLCTTNGGETWAFIRVLASKPVNSIFFVNEKHGWAITSAGGGSGSGGKGEGGGDEPKTKMSYILKFQPMATGVSVKSTDKSFVRHFNLLGNYPNPFNPSTTISYSISGTSPETISLVIYNVLGKAVRTLVDAHQQPGLHHVVWDGRNDAGERLASGIYLCQLKDAHHSQIKRMTLLY